MTDETTSLALLRKRLHKFVADRDWAHYHTPKNLAASIAIEAAELMEHFQWSTPEGSQRLAQDPQARSQIADELADVLIYCLHFANQMDIDVSSAIQAKLDRNEARFPAGYLPPSADPARDPR
jgi:NTP pyrophosphatase (non-canonical NTP hydrolase)